MKKKTLGRIAIISFALCMISMCLLSGTLAKYASSITGTGTVNVAEWTDISFKGAVKTANFDFDISDTKAQKDSVESTAIAPGDTGNFTVSTSVAEVDYTYSITINPVGNSVPIKFYSDDAYTTEITSGTPLTGTVDKDALEANIKTIYWKWVTTNDANDTALEGLSSEFSVVIEANQVIS